jgi:hypothetical protein
VTTTIRVELPRPHRGQIRVGEHRARFAVLALGRRWGKTTYQENQLIRTALAGDPAGWFAPTFPLLAEPWRDFKRRLRPVTRDVSEQEHRLELITGGTIQCWSLVDENPARGFKLKRAVIDEAGIVRGLLERWQEAIRPTLTDLQGDALFGGTPKGRNAFWQLYRRGETGVTDWSCHTGPTTENPHILASEVEKARLDLPDRVFRQEYLAEFIEDGAGVFRRVHEAAVLEPRGPVEGHWYVAGIDWGREHDYTVISVLDVTAREQVAMERYSQTEYALQMQRLQAVYDRYRPAALLAEANAMGGPLVEALQRKGWPIRPWTATNATKAAVVDQLALALDRGDVRILRDDAQTAELQAYTSERLPSGLIRYTAPEGMHDDTVIALALACEAASTAGPTPEPVAYALALGEKRNHDDRRDRFLSRRGVNPFARDDGA